MFGTATYSYDVLDNLTRVQVGATANLAARDHYYCYDANWRLTSIKTGSCTGTTVSALAYDVQGNLQNKDGRTFTFDFGNRLRTVSASGPTAITGYVYDGHGRRTRDLTVASKYSQYTSDGRLVQSSDSRIGVYSEYFYLQGSLVAIRERDSTVTPNVYSVKYQHTDALGSPVAVTDENRVVIERTEYEPYGRVGNRAPSDGPGFTGHVEDAATGLNYMQQRYYDPVVGRFLSADPMMTDPNTGAMFNRYSYAHNSPYRFTDPDGRCPTGTRVCMTEATLTKRLEALSVRSAEKPHKSANAAARYFAKEATKLQQLAGREIGANMEKRHDADYRVVDFHADSGNSARNHVTTWNYIGEYEWAGIMHTHPSMSLFSGRGSYGQNGRLVGVGWSDESDVAEGYFRGKIDVYVALPDEQVYRMNTANWVNATQADTSGRRVYAYEFEERIEP